MAIIVTCPNCGEQVPWRSGHCCRIEASDKFSIPGPGFNVRPKFYEARNYASRTPEILGDTFTPVKQQVARVIFTDRLALAEKQRRESRL